SPSTQVVVQTAPGEPEQHPNRLSLVRVLLPPDEELLEDKIGQLLADVPVRPARQEGEQLVDMCVVERAELGFAERHGNGPDRSGAPSRSEAGSHQALLVLQGHRRRLVATVRPRTGAASPKGTARPLGRPPTVPVSDQTPAAPPWCTRTSRSPSATPLNISANMSCSLSRGHPRANCTRHTSVASLTST